MRKTIKKVTLYSLFIFLICIPISSKAGKVDLLLLTDFEQLRQCIDLSPDLGILEKYRYKLSKVNDLEYEREFFETIGFKLFQKYGKPIIYIQGCECTPTICTYNN